MGRQQPPVTDKTSHRIFTGEFLLTHPQYSMSGKSEAQHMGKGHSYASRERAVANSTDGGSSFYQNADGTINRASYQNTGFAGADSQGSISITANKIVLGKGNRTINVPMD